MFRFSICNLVALFSCRRAVFLIPVLDVFKHYCTKLLSHQHCIVLRGLYATSISCLIFVSRVVVQPWLQGLQSPCLSISAPFKHYGFAVLCSAIQYESSQSVAQVAAAV